MPKPKASPYLRFRTPEGKQSPYCPALFDSKGRLRPFWCLFKGTPEHHPEAKYYSRYKRDGKWMWESLGTGAATAWSMATATYASDGVAPAPVEPVAKDSFRLDDEIRTYLSNVEKLSHKTHAAYRLTLDLFRQLTKIALATTASRMSSRSFVTRKDDVQVLR